MKPNNPKNNSLPTRIGLVLALYAILVVSWVMVMAVFSPQGPVGSHVVRAGGSPAIIRDVLNAGGFVWLLIVTMALRRKSLPAVIKLLGIWPFSWRAIVVTLVALCIAVGMLLAMGYRPHIGSANTLIAISAVGTFLEEALFRGFLFLQFRRWLGLPFWLAAVLASVPFALEHIYQGSSAIVLLEVLAWTFIGGILFCWLVERWGSLWASWALHAGLDFTYAIFPLGVNAAMSPIGNVQRLLVSILVIAATLLLTRRTTSVREQRTTLRL